MKILITGAKGFVGKNLTQELRNRGYNDLFLCDMATTHEELDRYTKECQFVFHLAGVNRPEREEEFMEGNFGFTSVLLEGLKRHENKASVLITSSIQAELDNPYGKSKLAGEELLRDYSKETGSGVFIYRLPNVFGKWCKPNYNSAVATFCHNIARDLPITVNNREHQMMLVYIDDVVDSFIEALDRTNEPKENSFFEVNPVHSTTLGEIVDLIYSFHGARSQGEKFLQIADMSEPFTKKLYSTYLSYLPEESFSYSLKMNVDDRGSFTEILKQESFGQVSVNISKPEITKGNHWHHTKNEKFLVVSGEGIIRFRSIRDELENPRIIEYKVSGEKLEILDIPPGYTHNISNLGTTDMVTIMWANESFDPDKPDTYFEEA